MPPTFEFPSLYKRDSNETDRLCFWRVIADVDQHVTEYGRVDGKVNRTKPTTAKPKNVGKANATTAEEQALADAKAKHDKKLKEGYFPTKEEALADKPDAWRKPMLAENYFARMGELKFPLWAQTKLNGVRCTIQMEGDELVAYSRKKERFHTIPHILKELSPLFKKRHGLVIDGEVFNFALRENLNRLTRLVNVTRKDPTKEDLEKSERIAQFHAYDMYDRDSSDLAEGTPYRRRYGHLTTLEQHYRQYFRVLSYDPVESHEDVRNHLKANIAAGHEGSILRDPDAPYEHKRSKHLLKVKQFRDEEFKILSIEDAVGNWAGCAKRVWCAIPKKMQIIDPKTQLPHKTEFASNVAGSMENLKEVFLKRATYTGKYATVRYQNISEYGVPQLPYILSIRDYE